MTKDAKDVIELIIARAVVDSDFRKQLLSDKDAIAKEYEVQGTDLEVLMRVDENLLESTRHAAAMLPVVHLRSSVES